MMKRFTLAAAALFALAAAGPAQAGTITFTLDNKIGTGDQPLGTPTVTITDLIGGGVQLTMNASALDPAQKISEWAFNVNSTSLTASNFSFVSGSVQAQSISLTRGSISGTGSAGGTFNIDFSFNTSAGGAFFGGNTVVYNIANVTTAMFTAPLNQISSTALWYTAAHIQSIPGATSGAVGTATYTNAVPEPASVAMALTAVGAMGLVSLRRRARTA